MEETMMKRNVKRVIALSMVAVMSFLAPGAPLARTVKGSESSHTYLKELRLFITESKNAMDKASEWCDKQNAKGDSDWQVISDNVNEGASSKLKTADKVYICADTTDDPSKAITDIAVMNENGNYDEGAYEIMLKEQKDAYTDYVADLKTMISEYRANYEKKLPTAVQAHDMLNRFKEDDSGKLVGDLLLTISDADLAEVLLQAQGQVVLYIEQQLGLACDKGKNTFLDRMEAFGSYAGLRKKFLRAYNNNAQKADAALKANFHDRALQVLDYWDDVNVHIDNINSFLTANGLDRMSQEQSDEWLEEHFTDLDTVISDEEFAALHVLASYSYDGKTLLQFFATPREEMEQDIKQLYPLVASLTDGQFAGANQGVSLYNLIQDAATQTMINGYSTGKAAELEEGIKDADKETADNIEEYKETLADNVDGWNSQEAVSVYEGVDRDIYKGGVAVTTTAVDFGKRSGGNWTDAFVDGSSHAFAWTAGALTVSSILSGFGACIFKYATVHTIDRVGGKVVQDVVKKAEQNSFYFRYYSVKGLRQSTIELIGKNVKLVKGKWDFVPAWNRIYKGTYTGALAERKLYQTAVDEMVERGFSKDPAAVTQVRRFAALKVGMAIFAVVLAVADIIMTVTTLINYYNRDHLPIPHHMVDLSYNEDEETSFIAYKSVKDDEGEYGDLNGGGGKQWLAIYTTKDKDAGNPILADSFVTQYGNDKIDNGYSPLHFFGKPNAPQNLTFADGSNGWSYNDSADGTYCFFKRDNNANVDDQGVGTSISKGVVIAAGGIGLVVGIAAGFGLNTLSRRRKKDGEK